MTSKTEKYLARLNDHLWWLHDDAARFDFITTELAKWEERRDAFIRKVDAGGDPGDATIFDYADTLGALEIEQAKYSPLKEVRAELSIAADEMEASVVNLEKALS